MVEKDKQEIMGLIYEQQGGLRPISLSDITEVRFFPWHNNTYQGWFVRANYVQTSEMWFIVDLRGSASDNDWWLEII